MINFFYKLFNHDKIAEQQKTIDIYKERNKQLEKYKKRCEDAELKVKCLQMYVDDDEAIDEIFEAAKTADRQASAERSHRNHMARLSAQGCGSGLGMGLAGGSNLRSGYL